MHNKVVTMTARALRELGAATRALQLPRHRRVRKAASTKAAAKSTTCTRSPPGSASNAPATRSGWPASASAPTSSLRAAASLKPDLLISIAPPAGRWDFDGIELPTMPWLVIQGENDEVVDPQAVYDWLREIARRRPNWCACPTPATSSIAS